MKKDGYTYFDADTNEPMALWKACITPGAKAGVMHGESDGKSKKFSHWEVLENVVRDGECFLVELPHHLVAIDIDSPMSIDGTGERILNYLDSKGIHYVLATSGSDGWVLIINLWTSLNQEETGIDYLTSNFDLKVRSIREGLETLIPFEGWNSRIRRSIRPPLSPYPFQGHLNLLVPSTVSGAAKILNYGGTLSNGVKPQNVSLESLYSPTTERQTRASYFMSLANSLIQAGYHFEEYKNILESERTPIGNLYQQRVREYNRSDEWIEKDLQSTWVKANEYVRNNPARGQIRIQILDWILFAWNRLLESTLPQPTRIRLIAYVLTIGKIAYEACSLEPVIGEKRMAVGTGTSNKTVLAYKFLLNDLGILEVSFEDTPDEVKHYGTMYRLRTGSVVFTDVNSPLTYLLGNRDITSVNGVYAKELRSQLNALLPIWKPNELWLQKASGRIKGRLAWSLLNILPKIQLEQLCLLLGWNLRIGRDVLIKLQQLSLIYWDEACGNWVCYESDSHWEEIVRIFNGR